MIILLYNVVLNVLNKKQKKMAFIQEYSCVPDFAFLGTNGC